MSFACGASLRLSTARVAQLIHQPAEISLGDSPTFEGFRPCAPGVTSLPGRWAVFEACMGGGLCMPGVACIQMLGKAGWRPAGRGLRGGEKRTPPLILLHDSTSKAAVGLDRSALALLISSFCMSSSFRMLSPSWPDPFSHKPTKSPFSWW